MRALFWNLSLRFRRLALEDNGQDLVEYALVLLLLSTGALAIMGHLGITLNSYFTAIGTDVP